MRSPNEILLDFTTGDFRSPTWEKLAAYLRARRDEMREENDGELSELATARLRGRLLEVGSLIELPRSAEMLRADHVEE